MLVRLLILTVFLFASPLLAQPSFPLRYGPTNRYLADQQNRPFLMHSIGVYALFTIRPADANVVLDHIKADGFNTIHWAELIPSPNAPTADGLGPFRTVGDMGSPPDSAYWQRVWAIMDLALQKELLVIAHPYWLGCCGGDWADQASLTPANAERYGRFVGQQLRRYPNLIWFIGGDRDPGKHLSALHATVAGLKATDRADRLFTYHGTSPHSSREAIGDASPLLTEQRANWLTVNLVYTYYTNAGKQYGLPQYHVYDRMLTEYNRKPVMPVYEGESKFEQPERVPGQWIRRTAYWSLLSGGMGHTYGYEDGRLPNPLLPGYRQMRYVRDLFAPRRWYDLVPDQTHQILTAGYGTYNASTEAGGDDYVTAAATPDGQLFIAYLPVGGTVTLNRARLASGRRAWWFDPTSGRRQTAGGGPTYRAPNRNQAGDKDWILLLE